MQNNKLLSYYDWIFILSKLQIFEKLEIKDLFFNYPTLTLQTNCNTQDILGLQTQNLALARHIKNLSQNSVPSDSGATFMKYVAMAGILALFVGVVATSTKIMAIINHVLNQQVGL